MTAVQAGMADDDVRDLYHDLILRHGKKPLHGQRLPVFSLSREADNPLCGDQVTVFIATGMPDDGNEVVEAVGFEAKGCAISIASADLMAETVRGLNRAQAHDVMKGFHALVRSGQVPDLECPVCHAALSRLQPLGGVHEYPSRIKCATLPWRALSAALELDEG
ncbi:Fe-S cluster assembly sulfur transfer protein SufU [Granulibacter bethesdensis]|uniref:IscU protein n=1 Tax=Granulibacter bethesdensis (strain ATCC BAA-1260 / CGDNIH1) TaxID=391165 RepID=Q0BSI3_GRABC|nr:SUF system NifU family Fe-S cluster assembly protein [Granulibacter bethesdensis]ABI62219.1 IscU protein [Granulibacter bethesdensis CGDNIH1]APH52046.1 IscU protein [Granulibacter bethesdensis]APH64736.1 IscU protein [Granulibacter bethesdensis]